MRLLLLTVLLLVFLGCGREVKDLPADMEPVPAEAPAIAQLVEQPPVAPECKPVNKAWLRQRPAAEGSILRVFEVSRARRKTIEQLNTQLAKLTAALKRGCLEAP